MQETLKLNKGPKQKRTRNREIEAEKEIARLYFAYRDEDDLIYIKKTPLNKKYGHSIASRVMSKYFILDTRGNNLSGKVNKYRTRSFSSLPPARQSFIKQLAFDDKADYPVSKQPEKYDQKSFVYIEKQNRNKAIQWCIDNDKLRYINDIKLLTTKSKWEIFYTEKSHRFFACWPVFFSQMPSAVRQILLKGDSVDLENAIGQFILFKLGKDAEKYPEVKRYLNEPILFRKELSEKFQIEERRIKKILHALLLGARINISNLKKGIGAIHKINPVVYKNIALVEGLTDFINQLKTVKKIIAKTNKLFAIKYFEWEQIAINQVFQALPMSSNKSRQALIIHDGIEGINLFNHNHKAITTILYGSVYKFKVSRKFIEPKRKEAYSYKPQIRVKND